MPIQNQGVSMENALNDFHATQAETAQFVISLIQACKTLAKQNAELMARLEKYEPKKETPQNTPVKNPDSEDVPKAE